MSKPWFGRKRFGWGWGSPETWQGWCLLIAYLVVLFLAGKIGPAGVYLVFLATVVFIGTIAVTSGKPQWGTWHENIKK